MELTSTANFKVYHNNRLIHCAMGLFGAIHIGRVTLKILLIISRSSEKTPAKNQRQMPANALFPGEDPGPADVNNLVFGVDHINAR